MRLMWILLLALPTTALAARKAVLVNAPAKVAFVLGKELAGKYALVALPQALGPAPTAKEVRDVAAPARAIAIIQVQAGGRYLTLQVLSGHDGTPLDTLTFKPPKKFKALPRDTAQALFAALSQGKAPPPEPKAPPADAPVAETPEEKGPAGEVKQALAQGEAAVSPDAGEAPVTEISGSSDSGGSRPSELPAIHTGVGFKAFARSFNWAAGHSDALASYQLPFAAAVAFDGTWYPGAHFTNGLAAHLGVFLNGEVGIGLASRQDDARYGTRADRFRFGARMRFPFGTRLLVDALVGYSTQTFAIAQQSATTGAPRPNIPSVTYNGPRLAGGGKVVIAGTFTAEALVGFMYVYGKGELASDKYFPNTTGLALDASMALSLEIVSNLRVRGAFDWTGYFLTTHADPSAIVTASGASDHFLGGTLSLVWVM
ncbi:MAG: hypothetical protein IT380_19890 [Myxococcales bacterium]|nr:hypothetical protein [Myxococcales bacterium]